MTSICYNFGDTLRPVAVDFVNATLLERAGTLNGKFAILDVQISMKK